MNWRFIPPALLVVLGGFKLAFPGFLSQSIFPHVPVLRHVSWWLLLFLVLLWVTAWCLTPSFMRIVHRGLGWCARVGLVPAFVFLGVLFAVLAGVDIIDHYLHEALPAVPELHVVDGFMGIFFRLTEAA